jgi:hypothetical protein
MAAMANLLVKDDATSPVEITFIPVTDTPTPFYRASIAGVPFEGQPRVTLTSEKLRNGSYKYTVKVEVPVMETLGASGTSAGYVAPPKVAYTNVYIGSMFVDARSTIADRANLLKLATGIIQGASATTATGVLSNTAAGDAWKNSTLPIPLMFTQGVMPN